MKGLVKAVWKIAQVLTQVLGAIMGNNVTTASEDAFKHYPRLAFGS